MVSGGVRCFTVGRLLKPATLILSRIACLDGIIGLDCTTTTARFSENTGYVELMYDLLLCKGKQL